jgi:hypothetical protein
MPVCNTPKGAVGLRADIALARKHAPKAIERLSILMNADDARISLAAATAILDRAYGRAAAGCEDTPQVQAITLIERIIIDRAGDPDR